VQVEGPDGETVSYIRANLGGPCLELGELDAAEAYYTQALKVLEPAVADDPIIIMRCYYGLSKIAWKRGDFETAHAWARRRVEIAEQHLPEDHPWRPAASMAVAEVYVAEGKSPEAEAEYQKVIDGYKQLLGPDSPVIAELFDEMEKTYKEAGLTEKAQECAKRAAAIRAEAQKAPSREEERPDQAATDDADETTAGNGAELNPDDETDTSAN
jgi:tetratricopeptide (TPR) repeat protein